jgi:hypothetical protein
MANNKATELFNQKIIKQATIATKLSVTFRVSLDIFDLNQQDSTLNRSKYSQYFVKWEFLRKDLTVNIKT